MSSKQLKKGIIKLPWTKILMKTQGKSEQICLVRLVAKCDCYVEVIDQVIYNACTEPFDYASG